MFDPLHPVLSPGADIAETFDIDDRAEVMVDTEPATGHALTTSQTIATQSLVREIAGADVLPDIAFASTR